MAKNDSGVKSATGLALGDVIGNIVCSFIECNSSNPGMLRLVFMLENMTTSAATYRTRQSHIEVYTSSDCVSHKLF